MATANGYNDDDRKRIVSAMQSMRDRLGGFLAKTYGDNFDGDIDTMLEAVNFMKAVRIEKPAAVPADFTEWLASEMPAGTVIGDPHWWAKLIARRFAQFANKETQP